ncbi:MAG: NADH-quinone oxidoreductase subunit N [Verrucomicrobiota bacterium]
MEFLKELLNLLRYPEFGILLLALLLLGYESLRNKTKSSWMAPFSMVGVAVIFALTFFYPLQYGMHWDGLYNLDALALFFKRFFLAVTFGVLWMGMVFEKKLKYGRDEFFVIPLFTTVGMLLLSSAVDFILIFVGLELVTISFYILVAYQREKQTSLEVGVKYLIIGALSTGFMVYGIALLFGLVGSTKLADVNTYIAYNEVSAMLLFSLLFLIVGLGFKVAAVPFHVWSPDVYEGAPTPVTAFLATASKAAGFLVLLRLFKFDAFGVDKVQESVSLVFAMVGCFTVLLGNFVATPQRNFKRLLAYSSIGHAGFLLLGLSTLSNRGVSSVIIYLVVYAIAALLAFFIITHLASKIGGYEISKFSGLSQREPLCAAGLIIALISMAGIPPLAGFVGKFSVMAALWENGNILCLAVAIIGAVIGLGYYLRVISVLFWNDPLPETEKLEIPLASQAVVVVLLVSLVVLGIWQTPLSQLLAWITGPTPS